MKFGPLTVDDPQLVGSILAHSLPLGDQKFKKGRVLSHADCEALRAAELASVIVARLDADDVDEDRAANDLAAAIIGQDNANNLDVTAAFTGRANVFAAQPGLLVVNQDALDQLNLIHQDLTVATLVPYSIVGARQMVATVKIIPFGVNKITLQQCIDTARKRAPLLRIAPFTRHQVGLIQTRLAGNKDSVLDKTVRVLDGRLQRFGATVMGEIRCDHDQIEVQKAIAHLLNDGAELVLIAGASAIVDRRDVIPAAIEAAGGRIEHYGMPVDPGNLLLLGYHPRAPIIGLPGCARSPKFNGLDMILPRLAAGLTVSARDIMRLGAGGLLKEIASRGAPRAGALSIPSAPGGAETLDTGNRQELERASGQAARIAALVLAGGQSRRMGPQNKLLVPIANGEPMIRRVANTILASQATPVIAVTGYQCEPVEQALAGLNLRLVHNPAFADGISTSLAAGLAALTAWAAEQQTVLDGVLVCLGDMPDVTADHINRLIAAFDPLEGRAICVPTVDGKRGNPVLWGRQFFDEMRDVAGDVGAKHLLGEHADQVCEVAMNDRGVLLDIDSPGGLNAWQRQ